jgi:hypothetical protein
MQGNSRIISPIAIDLGTKHNGVFLSHYREGEDPSQNSKVGTTFIVDNSKKTWSQADRTAKRHQRRGFKRRKLVKRLFRIILVELYHYDPITQPRVDRDFLLGLFNRRGFSYLTDDIDEEILTYADLSILEEFIPKLFNPSSKLNLLEQLVQKQENESELEKILDAEIFQISKKEQLTKVKEFFEDNTEQMII